MNHKTIELLEYDKIKEILKSYTLSDFGKDLVEKLEPNLNIRIIEKYMLETTEARTIVDMTSSIPIHGLNGIKNVMDKLEKDAVLHPEELDVIAGLLKDISRMKIFMKGKQSEAPTISLYAQSTFELNELRDEIERCIIYGNVCDKASAKLAKVRKKILILEDRIKSKLDSVIGSDKYKNCIQDAIVTKRSGRFVIPVKSEYRKNIDGDIHDRSGSGSTLFIEPAEVKKAQNELDICLAEEEREVFIILSTLTNMAAGFVRELTINVEAMAYYDFLFAKGKYSKSIDGRTVGLNSKNYINILNGRHPLIGKSAIPLNFEAGRDYRAVVITGPNTGGKTVALKTVGLLTMMAQSGLHIPVDEDSEIAVFGDILADIGDGQSIEQSLSTFSSHIRNIINILNCADDHTLVIIDEIGSGTDPGEGMGLAVSVLEEIYRKGAVILATTHYSEIKEFARTHSGFINGSMEFDINTLKPLYKLNIGVEGESNAFLIAIRLGMNSGIIERAHEVTYKEKKDYSKITWNTVGVGKNGSGVYADAENDIAHRQKAANMNGVEYLSSNADGICYTNSDDNCQAFIQDKEIDSINAHKQQIEMLKEAEKRNLIIEKQKLRTQFKLGDNVYISFMERTGIICELENSRGEYGVMVMKKRLKINKKRLELYISGDEMYPEDYDFDIIFESKTNRRNKHLISRKHAEGVEVVVKE